MYEDLKGFESCNNGTLKRHETLVANLSCINAPPSRLPLAIKGVRFHPENIEESDISWLFCFSMYEREMEYYGGEFHELRRAKREAGFFAVWSVADIKEARMNGLISPEQWDRLWPLLRSEAERYDADPEFKKNVMDVLPPFANMTMVEYLDRELNFPISSETAQKLAAKTARYVNGTLKRTNITPSEVGDIIKPLIDQAVRNLVQRKHPSKIYDKDIREEFDILIKGKLSPPIGNKEFYTWAGELGYQWVVDQDGKPVRSHGNRRVLSCCKSDGIHLTQDT